MSNSSLLGLKNETSAHRPSSPDFSEGRFVLESHEFDRAAETVRGMVRAKAYDVVHAARKPVFERNAVLLRAAVINDHSTDHQDRDALIVAHIFDAFRDKLDQTMREPVLFAAMTHDSEYIPAARQYAETQQRRLQGRINDLQMHDLRELELKFLPLQQSRQKWMAFLKQLNELETKPLDEVQNLWVDGGFPRQIDKKALDPHAELGEARIRREFKDPAFAPAYGNWTDEQQEVAALAIRDHSNGSQYDPFATPLEAQVLRMGDKIDNTFHRVGEWMIGPSSLKDPTRCHRFVPTAIRSQSIIIDRGAKEFRIIYDVDTSHVERLMRRTTDFSYSRDEFVAHFEEAYGRTSMPRAAEVHAKLEAEPGDMYANDATFKVELRFPDGQSVINTYEPAPTAPSFS